MYLQLSVYTFIKVIQLNNHLRETNIRIIYNVTKYLPLSVYTYVLTLKRYHLQNYF